MRSKLSRSLVATAGLAAIVALATIDLRAIADNVDVKIDEWMTPSSPPYPHDPAVAPDGSVWYTGQRANVVGRFDPRTQQFKEFPSPSPGPAPPATNPNKAATTGTPANPPRLIGK